MADASRGLPIHFLATPEQLGFVRDWHHAPITYLDYYKDPNRDENAILRSERTISNINKVLQAKASHHG